MTTADVVEKVHAIVNEERRIKMREIAEIVGISTERTFNILLEKTHMKKLFAGAFVCILVLANSCYK